MVFCLWGGKMIKTILFDLDDTLIDTKIYRKLYQTILLMIEKKRKLSGKDLDNKAKELGLKKNRSDRWDTGDLCKELGLLDEYYVELEKLIEVVPVLHDTVETIFEELEKKGKNIVIVSNSMRRTINAFLKKYALSKYVKFIFSQDDAGCRKYNLQFWKMLLKKENLVPEECLMVGDDILEDVELPKKLGFNTFHVENVKRLSGVLDFV